MRSTSGGSSASSAKGSSSKGMASVAAVGMLNIVRFIGMSWELVVLCSNCAIALWVVMGMRMSIIRKKKDNKGRGQLNPV